MKFVYVLIVASALALGAYVYTLFANLAKAAMYILAIT